MAVKIASKAPLKKEKNELTLHAVGKNVAKLGTRHKLFEK